MRLDLVFPLALLGLSSVSLQEAQDERKDTTQDAAATSKRTPAPLVVSEQPGVGRLARAGTILLASQPTAEGLSVLFGEGTRTVVDLRGTKERRGFDEASHVARLGMAYVPLPVPGAAALTDSVLEEGRRLLQRHRDDPRAGDLLLHCASAERASALWLTSRVLDEGVAWKPALAEAQRAGLSSRKLEDVARHYVLGAGKQKLGRWKEKIRAELPGVKRIEVDELAVLLQQEGARPLLLDTREAEEFAVSHLPGARNAPGIAEALALLQQGPREREVVLYCSIGYRSARLTWELSQRGFPDVRNLEGSIFEWANTGHAVFRSGEAVREVHPYDREWGQLLDRELWSWGGR